MSALHLRQRDECRYDPVSLGEVMLRLDPGALSVTTPDVIAEAVIAAHRHGTVVSYDLNYRPMSADRLAPNRSTADSPSTST